MMTKPSGDGRTVRFRNPVEKALGSGTVGVIRVGEAPAFTLVEMLVVMVIIIILLTLVVPATVSLLRGSRVTQGGDFLSSQLDLARQYALARNRSVQVRLCRPTGGQYTAIMLLFSTPATNQNGTPILNADKSQKMNYTPAGKPASLPAGIIIDAGTTLSTILNPVNVNATTASTTDPALGSQGTAYSYIAFQFKPDGSTDLISQNPPPPPNGAATTAPASLWFLTAHNATDGDSLAKAPANYYTIQVDAYNGHVRSFRP